MFNHEESTRKCLADYSKYRSWPVNRYQPAALRFRGTHVLTVNRADNPSDCYWENLDTSACERKTRVVLVWMISLVLVMLGATVVLAGSKYNIQFKELQPDMSKCQRDLPANYLGISVYEWPTDATPVWPVRNVSADAGCPVDADGNRQYHLDYAKSVRPPATEDPRHMRCIDPCVNMATTDMCNTTACYIAELQNSVDCDEFPRTTVAGCYCAEKLRVFVETHGLLTGASLMWDAEGSLCQVI